jgi:hypothetical protein
MLNRLIEWSIRNRLLVLLATAFLVATGIWAVRTTPVDAIPDLSDVQVIVQTEWAEQAPQIIEDQVTYPLTTALLAVPGATTVRGISSFGISYVYVLFDDGTDPYWARTRVLEYLSQVSEQMPAGVTPQLGPDATGVGWVYQYTLESDRHDLVELRSLQDFFVRYQLQSVPGVSEVATVGGHVQQYQVEVDPQRLHGYNLTVQRVSDAMRMANSDVGARVLELSGREYMVRGLGYLTNIEDIENVVLTAGMDGTPVRVSDVARVQLGPDIRRGAADKNGRGDVVTGIVVMRHGENALDVIDAVKARIAVIQAGLPAGVRVVDAYDRAPLIRRRDQQPAEEAGRGAAAGGADHCAVPAAHPQLARRGRDAADRHPDVVHRDAADRRAGEHHVDGRDRDRDRCDDRCSRRHGGESAQAPGARARPHLAAAALGDRRIRLEGGGARAVLQPARHHRLVPAGVCTGGAGRPPVQAAGVHEDVRNGLRGHPGGDTGPGGDGLLHPRPHPVGAGEPGEPRPDPRLSPRARGRSGIAG